jgi:FAD/FMN-containing dehydrogenase
MEQGKRTTAHGVCLQVRISGHATVGGQGVLSHVYGLKFDHIVRMEVVIADGLIVQASATKNPDLSWVIIAGSSSVTQALRGASASFGIITPFMGMAASSFQEPLGAAHL